MSYVTKSPWVIHYDGSSCNGCDIEVLACLTPMYDVERFGIINTGNPKHADVFLVTGSVNDQNKDVVKQIYDQMPDPKVVVAVGICANNGGVFRECYNILGGVDSVIPVDVYVPGCAARPEAIIDGVVKGLGVLAEKKEAMGNISEMEMENQIAETEEAAAVEETPVAEESETTEETPVAEESEEAEATEETPVAEEPEEAEATEENSDGTQDSDEKEEA